MTTLFFDKPGYFIIRYYSVLTSVQSIVEFLTGFIQTELPNQSPTPYKQHRLSWNGA